MIFILDFCKATGALIGLAIGDAMGAPLEGGPPPGSFITTMKEGGIHGVRRGHITDDTMQAKAIAQSLIACNGYSPADIMHRFLKGYRQNPHFYGPTSSAVFNLVLKGVSVKSAAFLVHIQKGGSSTNGSVMRGAPLGIFYPPEMVWPVSMACSRLTHYDALAGECSAFINRMISELCRGQSKTKAYSRALAACTIPKVTRILGNNVAVPLNPSLDALDATHCAVSIFLDSATFEEAVERAINLGGDTDTIGALCGALAGSHTGVREIPPQWLAVLSQREEIIALSFQLIWAATH